MFRATEFWGCKPQPIKKSNIITLEPINHQSEYHHVAGDRIKSSVIPLMKIKSPCTVFAVVKRGHRRCY